MTYANWRFGVPGVDQVAVTAHLDNDPGPRAHLYLQLYDAPIDATPTYHGLQTIELAIFSRFGTVDLGCVRPAPGTEAVAGTDEGPFVSIRRHFPLGPGTFKSCLARREPQGGGDWFEYQVARVHPGGGSPLEPTVVGAIWFPRARPAVPARIGDYGGSWTECWDNNTGVRHDVPYWKVRLDPPVANGNLRATGATLRCSRMPNGTIEWDSQAEQVVSVIGGDTWRRGSGVREVRWA